MVENIILDVDGTLWDSSETITKSWNEVYRRRGLSRRFTVEEVNSYMGKLPSEIAEELCGGLSEKERSDIVEDCMSTQLKLLEKEGGRLYPGVFETLKRLSGRYGIFIVSNCGCGYIEKLFSFTGIGAFVKDYLCAGMTGKNKGENLKFLMEKENLKNCVYIGDTRMDEIACRYAGIPFIWAAYGFGKSEKPAAVLYSFSEVEAVILTL